MYGRFEVVGGVLGWSGGLTRRQTVAVELLSLSATLSLSLLLRSAGIQGRGAVVWWFHGDDGGELMEE